MVFILGKKEKSKIIRNIVGTFNKVYVSVNCQYGTNMFGEFIYPAKKR